MIAVMVTCYTLLKVTETSSTASPTAEMVRYIHVLYVLAKRSTAWTSGFFMIHQYTCTGNKCLICGCTCMYSMHIPVHETEITTVQMYPFHIPQTWLLNDIALGTCPTCMYVPFTLM